MESRRGRQIRWVAAGAMVGMCIVGSATLLWPHRDKHNNSGLLSQGKGGLEAEGAGFAANLRASIQGEQGNGVHDRGRQER